MILKHLHLRSFRAHTDTRVDFAPNVNLILGGNGVGKTNLLEAIHYLCLTKSFLATQDAYVLQEDAAFFEVEGTFEGRQRSALRVRLAYVPGEGKKMFVNGAPLERLSEIVGMLPVVVFSPDDQALTAGGPDERRRFLNNLLSQARPVYLDDLMKYRRALRQRNELLGQYRKRRQRVPAGLMAPWDEELVVLGSRIVAARHHFLLGFTAHLARAYQHLEAVAEEPTITYRTVVPLKKNDTEATIAARYREALAERADREHERGLTLLGPHRDEMVFRLNGREVRRYASQGQHRTFGIALKLAKYFYLDAFLDEPPLLLLDDVFDHLDARRTAAIFALIQQDEVQQSLITAARVAPFTEAVPWADARNRALFVKPGPEVAPLAPEALKELQ